jgi:hypothetical protein
MTKNLINFLISVPDGDPCIIAFKFQTSYYALDSWDKRQTELFRWRAILHQVSQIEIS